MLFLAAFGYRLPAAGWKPDGWEPPQAAAGTKLFPDMTRNQAMR